jgi:hypothetical protein
MAGVLFRTHIAYPRGAGTNLWTILLVSGNDLTVRGLVQGMIATKPAPQVEAHSPAGHLEKPALPGLTCGRALNRGAAGKLRWHPTLCLLG